MGHGTAAIESGNWREGELPRSAYAATPGRWPCASSRRCPSAVLIVMAPPGAQAADLVVWWEQGFNPEEDAAVRETVAAFEQKTGKQVVLDLPPHDDIEAKIVAAVSAGQPPDFLFGFSTDSFTANGPTRTG